VEEAHAEDALDKLSVRLQPIGKHHAGLLMLIELDQWRSTVFTAEKRAPNEKAARKGCKTVRI
jgi:hypothetical protein